MRIFHKLFLLLALTAMGSALAIAAVLTWNLDRGFGHYLDARDADLLENFATEIETALTSGNGQAPASDPSQDLKRAVERLADGGLIRGLPPVGPPRMGREKGAPGAGAPPGKSKLGPPPDEFGKRLRVIDADGELLFGPPLGPVDMQAEVPPRHIAVGGRTVGWLSLLPRGPSPRGSDARFLRSQFVGIAIAMAALLVLTALFSWLVAKGGARRFDAIKRTTDALASGHLAARVKVQGTDEFAALGNDVNAMAQSLERLESARRQWLAEISHELRTPLTVLKGELAALLDGIRPIGREAVVSLSEESERLSLLIDDLHFLAISDMGAAPANFENLDAVQMLHQVAARFVPATSAAGLDIAVDHDGLSQLEVCWDKQRIEQLLGNLITNSIRYTDAPGQICLGLASAAQQVTITVDDSAPGIPAEDCESIFEPLRRLDDARDRESGGSGLGLSVARAIAEAHHGTIEAGQSQLGGLRISITLPVEANRK